MQKIAVIAAQPEAQSPQTEANLQQLTATALPTGRARRV
jgi:hypothetical protein